MKIETIFYTQIGSVIGFIIALFVLYRILVSQKDSLIELLREKNVFLEKKISEFENQTPDVLVNSLASRVEISKTEILRLKEDSELHKTEITVKEHELNRLRSQLNKLTELIEDSEFLCPECKAPLSRRDSHTIYGHVGGREVEADVEVVEYECGLVLEEGKAEPISPCKNTIKKDHP